MENNTIYNILWFDDDFEPINFEEGYSENSDREIFLDDVALAEDFGIKVEGVWNLQDFKERIKKSSKYQAVIFDLRGLDCNDKFNDYIMPEAKEIVDKLPNIEVFVYSSNIHYPKFDITLKKINERGHVFNKGERPNKLYEKIRCVLDGNLHYYKNHPECLSLFNEGVLNHTNRPHMDELLKKLEDKDSLYSPYNSMRQILEDMLDKLQKYRIIRAVDKGDKFETFNSRMKYLTDEFYSMKDSNGKNILDYDNPKVPYELCRREIKYILKYLKDITNHYSHFLEKNQNYLKEFDGYGCNLLVQQSAYKAFFVAMKWYYSLMHNRPINSLGPFPMEKDETNTFHCGLDYMISYSTVKENQINVGDFVYILWSVQNDNEKTKEKYRFYAKKIVKRDL